MTNFVPLQKDTYSKKHTWHQRVEPMFDLYSILAGEIRKEIDAEIVKQLYGLRTVKDGTK